MRPTGVFKRRPLEVPIGWDVMSKADWFDAYVDLYRQTHGEQAKAEEAMRDAQERHAGALAPLRAEQARLFKSAVDAVAAKPRAIGPVGNMPGYKRGPK